MWDPLTGLFPWWNDKGVKFLVIIALNQCINYGPSCFFFSVVCGIIMPMIIMSISCVSMCFIFLPAPVLCTVEILLMAPMVLNKGRLSGPSFFMGLGWDPYREKGRFSMCWGGTGARIPQWPRASLSLSYFCWGECSRTLTPSRPCRP